VREPRSPVTRRDLVPLFRHGRTCPFIAMSLQTCE
jgi:hypothetical protein